jgi:radical SAM-linked protein
MHKYVLKFSKEGYIKYTSHLDMLRLFKRAFKKCDIRLEHSQGFNPHPKMGFAQPLSLGYTSRCELLEYELEGEEKPAHKEIVARLNEALVEGVRVIHSYDNCAKIKNLAYLDATVDLEYDKGIPAGAEAAVGELFSGKELLVEKKGKNGPTQQDIIPMIKKLEISAADDHVLRLNVRVCCQNPSLNPMQLAAAIEKYLPEFAPDFSKSARVNLYDVNEHIFR